jgi:glutamate---cysteine ligase / carboxylate-amine ligase
VSAAADRGPGPSPDHASAHRPRADHAPAPAPSAESLRAAFDAAPALTVGLEEELMLLDPYTGDLSAVAGELLARVAGDRRFKLELPAAQLEILTQPRKTVSEAAAELARGRRDLAGAAAGLADLAAAGTHPFAAAEGDLNPGGRYRRTGDEYGAYARRQLVFALQVHVAPGSADRALAIYNALRSHLADLAALAANAPYHQGRDTGLASVRPKIAESLPRQGVPPSFSSWEEYADALRWGAAAGSVPDASAWWWELRPHPLFGTLELRVPDAQTTVAESAAVAAVAQCLVARLGELHDAGERLAVAPSWRLEENRWWAARDGLEAELADPATGRRRQVRERLGALLGELEPVAERLGCSGELLAARRLVLENGAMRQRAVGREVGPEGLVRWLRERWLPNDR